MSGHAEDDDTPKSEETIEELLARQARIEAKREAKAKKNLARAARRMNAQAIELLQNDDLKPGDIPISLILRRALLCAFSANDNAALNNLKFLGDTIGAKQKAKKSSDDDGEGGKLLERLG